MIIIIKSVSHELHRFLFYLLESKCALGLEEKRHFHLRCVLQVVLNISENLWACNSSAPNAIIRYKTLHTACPHVNLSLQLNRLFSFTKKKTASRFIHVGQDFKKLLCKWSGSE